MKAHAEILGFLPRPRLQQMLDVLHTEGYDCVGPVVEQGAMQLRSLRSIDEMSPGITIEQTPGAYRITQGPGDRLFAWANGPQGLKPFNFAPQEVLWRAQRVDGALAFEAVEPLVRPTAFIGVRACDLAALALQDEHFLDGETPDPAYSARRTGQLFIGVDCSHPAATCFCASTGDGPALQVGFDIGLTELDDGYVVRAGTEMGREICVQLQLDPPDHSRMAAAEAQNDSAIRAQQRSVPGRDLRDLLFARLEHPHWDDIAARCLGCGNCTAVCPTCFCSSYRSGPTLEGEVSEQVREWDSCFTPTHSEMHGRPARPDIRARYRQWLTHKFAGWHEQYGRSGCVGCGRCIVWCPVGIDVTAELQTLARDAQ